MLKFANASGSDLTVRFSGCDSVKFARMKDKLVSEFRRDGCYDFIDPSYMPPAVAHSSDTPHWTVDQEIPNVPPHPAVAGLNPILFHLILGVGVPDRLAVATRGEGWQSKNHGVVYENYVSMVDIEYPVFFARKDFEAKRANFISLHAREANPVNHIAGEEERLTRRNELRDEHDKNYLDQIHGIQKQYNARVEQLSKVRSEFSSKRSKCVAVFYRCFDGAALASIEHLLAQDKLRAAWIHLIETNSPGADQMVNFLQLLTNRLETMRYLPDMDMPEFLREFEIVVAQLASAGVTVTDVTRSNYLSTILEKSPVKSYRTAIEVWRLTPNRTYEMLKANLIAHFTSYKEKNHNTKLQASLVGNAGNYSESSNVAQSDAKGKGKAGKANRKGKKDWFKCHKCHQPGHYIKNCPLWKEKGNDSESSTKDGKKGKSSAVDIREEVRKVTRKND